MATRADPLVEEAAERVRRTGERVTEARVQVLAELLRSEAARTHAELERSLAGHMPNRVTLYRVLEWLVRQGLVHRLTGTDRAWRFSAAERRHEAHAHFQCNQCGRVVCLEEVRTRRSLPLPRGFRAQAVEMTVKGVCAACG